MPGSADAPDLRAPEWRAANDRLRRTIMGGVVAQAVHAVTVLGVPDRLAGGPLPVGELARSAGADVGALRRFLRLLAAEGVFSEGPGDVFRLDRMGWLLCSGMPGSLSHLSDLMADEAYLVWSQAVHSLRTGRAAFPEMYGRPYFEWLADNPERSAAFNRSQAGLVSLRALPLLERDWSDATAVVDVGGGNGALLAALLERHRHLKGVLFDLPEVVAEAEHTLAESGAAERARCVGGDFFTGIVAGGDVYVMAQILHDWNDDDAAAILRECRRAMPDDGRLLLLEQVVPEDGDPHPARLLDLHMLILLGGRERTEGEWRELLERGGFGAGRVTQGARSALIEASPAV